MAGRVEGKVAFVTGAARGQGRNHALRLAQEGADIIAVDIAGPIDSMLYDLATHDDLAETVRQVEATGRRIIATTTDVRDSTGMKKAIDDGAAELGKLDIVVGNAGILHTAPWDEVTEDMWDDTIAVNMKGSWNTVRFTAPHLIANGGGAIVLTSSVTGTKGYPWHSAYVASKHGIIGLMRAYATELAEYNIRVNTINPRGVDTKTAINSPEAWAASAPLLEKHPNVVGMLGNLLQTKDTVSNLTHLDDSSNAVLFLVSDESRYITSICLPVDAGAAQY